MAFRSGRVRVFAFALHRRLASVLAPRVDRINRIRRRLVRHVCKGPCAHILPCLICLYPLSHSLNTGMRASNPLHLSFFCVLSQLAKVDDFTDLLAKAAGELLAV